MPVGEYIRSVDHSAKLSEILKPYRFVKGQAAWNKGISFVRGPSKKPMSQEWKDKLSKSLIGRKTWNKGIRGSKSHCWKGGIAGLTNLIRCTEEYLIWRSEVFRRDGWTCQTCGFRGHGKDIEAHHIVPLNYFLKKALLVSADIEGQIVHAKSIPDIFSINNGVTLCKKCHILTHAKTSRSKPIGLQDSLKIKGDYHVSS